jgi:hypothetical protein
VLQTELAALLRRGEVWEGDGRTLAEQLSQRTSQRLGMRVIAMPFLRADGRRCVDVELTVPRLEGFHLAADFPRNTGGE